MLYLSQLPGMPVEDVQHVRVGKVIDVLVPAELVGQAGPVYPAALLVEGNEEQVWRVPYNALEAPDSLVRLRIPAQQLSDQPSPPTEDEVSLVQEVLDKEVIDFVRKKTIRVNDVCLDESWSILGIDASAFGLIRRLAPAWLLGARRRHPPSSLVPWERIELISAQRPMDHEPEESGEAEQFVITSPHRALRGRIADLHPADIAEIIHQLTPGEGARLIETLDDETAAETMEEIDTERQQYILENIEPERAAAIVHIMGPDKIADLLAQLPEERAAELMRLMSPEESEEVQELLEYEADTAGGLMTTDYLVLNQSRAVAQALEVVRSNIQENNIRMAYIYCVEDETQDESRVIGVVSVWDLLSSSPTSLLQELMETDLITVQPESDARSVAEKMAKYNLLAVPVINSEGILEGVVMVDDALDVLLPPERRRKPPRMY